ncbi:MAG: hypothetical protein HC803_01145 [Saprospiraceae bacterium]|nr:hypothetical protein [Saprospiraceae bacterium]
MRTLSKTDFFIAAENDDKLGHKVILLIEKGIENEGEIDIENLKIHLKSVLSKFEMPKKIYVLPRFERTETGKIQRGKTVFKLKLK